MIFAIFSLVYLLDFSQAFNLANNNNLFSPNNYYNCKFSRYCSNKISHIQNYYEEKDGVLSSRVSLKQSSRPMVGEESFDDGDQSNEGDDSIQMGKVKIDDGGSDLTDRFKFKVHALMGDYDPPENQANDEYADGNILNAMMTFPTKYSFHVVGRTGGDDAISMEYIEQVRKVVKSNCSDPQQVICDNVTPRGKNYLKVTVHGMVESAAMINNIYDELDALEMTKMRF